MFERLKSWLVKSLQIPEIKRDLAQVKQGTNTIKALLLEQELRQAAWHAAAANQDLKMESLIKEMDLTLAALSLHLRNAVQRDSAIETTGLDDLPRLADEIRRLGDLVKQTKERQPDFGPSHDR